MNQLIKQLLEIEYQIAHDDLEDWLAKLNNDADTSLLDDDDKLYDEAYRYGLYDAFCVVMGIIEDWGDNS